MSYGIKDTVGPVKFPRDSEAPNPCGTLVTSNGTGYDVTVPYFCAKAYHFSG